MAGSMRHPVAAVNLRWARVLSWLLALALVGGCAGSSDPGPDVTLDLTVSPSPPRVGPSTLIVTMNDAAGEPVSGARMELEGTMTHPGMKPEFADAVEVAPGTYQADMTFTMGGDWIIIVRCTLVDGSKLEREIEVRGVQAG